jgi:uroporphyrinogen-III synthase
MRVLITRPMDDAAATGTRLRELGHTALIAPLLSVHYVDGARLDLDGVQGVLATSANGLRALARRTPRRDLPVYAVGPQTAAWAREAGFTDVESADGDAVALGKAVPRWATPGSGTLLHPTGGDGAGRLATSLGADGYDVRTLVLYEVVASAALPQEAAHALSQGDLDAALFFSPRSAHVFAQCIAAGGFSDACSGLDAVCISEAAAKALSPLIFKAVRIAPRPNQEDLLACLS